MAGTFALHENDKRVRISRSWPIAALKSYFANQLVRDQRYDKVNCWRQRTTVTSQSSRARADRGHKQSEVVGGALFGPCLSEVTNRILMKARQDERARERTSLVIQVELSDNERQRADKVARTLNATRESLFSWLNMHPVSLEK